MSRREHSRGLLPLGARPTIFAGIWECEADGVVQARLWEQANALRDGREYKLAPMVTCVVYFPRDCADSENEHWRVHFGREYVNREFATRQEALMFAAQLQCGTEKAA